MRALIFALCLLTSPALADVVGFASVINGDTIEVHGQRIRLHWIDAPERRQLCFIDRKRWQCVKGAANALACAGDKGHFAIQPKVCSRHGALSSCHAAVAF